jgi:peptidyl-prolyl cis-trans isomerase C
MAISSSSSSRRQNSEMNMSRRSAAATAFLAASVTALTFAAGGQVLVDVGTNQVTVDQFEQVLRTMRATGGSATAIQTFTPSGRNKILSAYVDSVLYAKAARDEGLDRRPDVRFAIDQAVQEVLARTFLESKVAALPLTDADLQQFYDAHPDQFRTPLRVKARHILVRTPQEAEAVLKRLKSGEPFDKVAREISVDATTKSKGGELGWVTPGTMVKPFEDALFALKKGEVSGVVQTNFGYHVIEAEDVQQTSLPPFESIKGAVKEKAVAASVVALRAQLAARYPVHVHEDALKVLK